MCRDDDLFDAGHQRRPVVALVGFLTHHRIGSVARLFETPQHVFEQCERTAGIMNADREQDA